MSTSTPTLSSQPPSTSYTIRPALSADVPDLLAMITELAEYEHASDSVLATETSLSATLSFPDTDDSPNTAPGFGSRVARALLILPTDSKATDSTDASAATAAGMALYFHNYSTWRATPGIYLEDLYVRPEFRGRGYGTALLQALAAETVRVGGERARLEWSVLKWNEPSIRFYQGESVGAERMEEWVGMRVEGAGLGKLAGTGSGVHSID